MTINHDAEKHRIQLIFNEVPPREFRKDLKNQGWRWAFGNRECRREDTTEGFEAIEWVKEQYPSLRPKEGIVQQTNEQPKPRESVKEEIKETVGILQIQCDDRNACHVLFYDDKQSYLKAIREQVDTDPSGFKYKILSQDTELRRIIADMTNDENKIHDNSSYPGDLNYFASKGVVGTIEFVESSKHSYVKNYVDEQLYLNDLKKQFDVNPGGIKFKTHSYNPELRKNIDDMVYGLYGEENPHASSHYTQGVLCYRQNVSKMLEAFEKGRAPFLPEDGQCNPVAVRSAITGDAFGGPYQLLAQLELSQWKTNDTFFITNDEAQELGTFIRKGSPLFATTTFGGTENIDHHYFPASAVDNALVLPKHEFHTTLDKQIVCTEASPEEYIGKYLAACEMGVTFKASPEIVADFRRTMVNELKHNVQEHDYINFFMIGGRAARVCTDLLKDMTLPSPERARPLERQPAQPSRQGCTAEFGY